jgi:murein DD-endopeptidase MepM/ murein hydrolase activator NlpD
MDDKIPEGLEDLLKGIIEDDEKIPEGLDDLLDSVRDTPEPPGALATIPKKSDDLVDEEIDSQILSILGLEDVFDLTYEEYASLLKEASIKGRMADSQMTTESIELVTNELKRVKGKTGKFKVKPKKVDINKVLNRKPGAIVKVDNLKPEDKESEAAEDKSDSDEFKKDVNDGINKILGSLITIKSVLDKQRGIAERTAKRERRTEEKEKKSRRENKLEKKKEDKKKTNKLPDAKPIGGFFDMIKRFFTNILIGGVVLKIFNWMNDPENKDSIERFKNFMVDNAPLILGGLLAIASLPLASTLLGLTTTIISGITLLGSALGGLTALLPAFALFGLYVGGQVITKNLLKYIGGEDAAKVGSEVSRLKDEILIKRGQVLLIQDKDKKKKALDQLDKDEELLRRIEEELMPRMGKTQSIKRQLEQTKVKLEKDEENLLRAKGYEDTPYYKNLVTDIEKSKKIIKDAEINLPISQKRQADLMKELFPEGGPKGDILDRLDTFVQDSKKIVSDLKSGVSSLQNDNSTRSGPDPNATFSSPDTNKFSSVFGSKESFRKKAHEGIDDPIPSGTPLSFNQPGKILDVFRTSSTDRDAGGGYGQFVKVKLDDGKILLMAHLSDVESWVKNGVEFDANQIIAKSGGIPGAPGSGRSGGAHLHFEQHSTPGLGLEETLSGKVDPIAGGGVAALQYSGISRRDNSSIDSSKTKRGEIAQIARKPVSAPSISPPNGRSGIGILPMPMGGGGSKGSTSGSGAGQTKLPFFSSEDPNNMTMMVVKGIYNVVG